MMFAAPGILKLQATLTMLLVQAQAYYTNIENLSYTFNKYCLLGLMKKSLLETAGYLRGNGICAQLV